MVKDEKWSKEGGTFETQGYRTKKAKDGERFWDLEDLPNVIERFIEKTTVKKWRNMYSAVRDFVRKQSELLFLMINRDAVGKMYNPYDDWSTVKVWQALNENYNQRKRKHGTHNRFWLYKGGLKNYLSETLPSKVFGTPEVYANYNNKAKGYQNMHITIRPYPRAGQPGVGTGPIYNKLFGRHYWGGSFRSNEDVRPIMAPAMRKLMDTRIKNGVKRIMKETWEK